LILASAGGNFSLKGVKGRKKGEGVELLLGYVDDVDVVDDVENDWRDSLKNHNQHENV